METPNLEEERPEIVAYIHWLESRLEGATMLSKEVSLLKAGVAHDLQLVRLNEQGDEYEHLKYICLDKQSPKYNLVKVLMLNINSVETEVKPIGRPIKEVKETEEVETIAIAGDLSHQGPQGNVFEETSRKLTMRKVNGGK
jgi:hypothetical protein